MNYLTRRLITDGAKAVGHAAARLVERVVRIAFLTSLACIVLLLVFFAGMGVHAAITAFTPIVVQHEYRPDDLPF